jgi:hypothetical protein
MARQEVNIGVEGNDGTGDSIRESFRKTNENFSELYAVFGIGGQITLSSLSDTPNTYNSAAGKILAVKSDELGVEYLELASDGAVSGDAADDTIVFNQTVSGKLIISTAFSSVQSDTAPQLGGPMDANNFGIGKVAVSEVAAQALSNKYNEDFTIEDLVITKRHGGESYLKRGAPGASANVRDEPSDATEYTFTINGFTVTEVLIPGHGLDSGSNGAGYRYSSTDTAATNLVNNNTYYIRVIDNDNVSLHNSSLAAKNDTGAIAVTGGTGTQTLFDLGYDNTLDGFWLDTEALPRKSVVRRQGDTMTGALNLHDHPGDLAGQGAVVGPDDLQAATKYYVDNARYESSTNLYVNPQGTDSQVYTPPGKEGRSSNFAFRSIEKACEEAEILQLASPFETGPYMQPITYDDTANPALISSAGIQTIVSGRETVQFLIEANKDFIVAEVVAYVNATYPDFAYDTVTCGRDIGYILDSVVLDVLSGNNANYLSRWAGIRYYSSPSAKKAITTQGTETVAAINYAKTVADDVLRNNTVTALQSDETQTIDITKVVDASALASVAAKFEIVKDVIDDGPLDAPNIVDGSVYELTITNGGFGHVDQGDPNNTDLLPGKIIKGKTSGARAIIVNYLYEDDPLTVTPSGNDRLELQLVEPIEFIANEEIEYGNAVRFNNISIMVETGTYYEDYPIRVPANVSIVGDEFRRTIIRPKNRSSQSRYANLYFYRDKEFDGLTGDSASITGFPDVNLPVGGTEYTNPLTSTVDGYFGYHYLQDPTTPLNIDAAGTFGNTTYNNKLYTDAPGLIELNKDFIIEEVIQYINATYPALVYNETKCRRDTGLIIDALISDLTLSGRENSVEVQTAYYTGAVLGQETETAAAITYIKTIAADVLTNSNFSALGSVPQVVDVTKTSETGANLAFNSLVDLVAFAFDAGYNPARNSMDLDAFLMNDATRMTGLTVQGHGGFMCVLDPEGQVLTKSPYIQVGSSFSQSINRQAFRGGQLIDAFAANIPARVVSKDDAFTLNISSAAGEGLFYKKPQTPCPFYIDGERFQVNAVREWDPVTGTAKLILDRTSFNGNGFTGSTATLLNVDLDDLSSPLPITIQTAGNRSMLGNDFTQINDFGYGLIVVNGGLCEQVSQFTYYCWTSYYAKNGGQIRSLNGSNAYGEYGLVAEGADPNEIPDAVSLEHNMMQPLRTFTADVALTLGNVTSFALAAGDQLTQAVSGATGDVVFEVDGNTNTKIYLTNVSGSWDNSNSVSVSSGTGSITGTSTPTLAVAIGLTNPIESLRVYIYDNSHPIQNRGEVEINHTSNVIGRYEMSNISDTSATAIVDGHFDIDATIYSTTSVSGTGAIFTVGGTRAGYKVYNYNGGATYDVNDTVTIPGNSLGGATPTNDLTITVSSISDSGVITGITVAGTPVINANTPYFDGRVYKLNFTTGSEDFSSDGLLATVPANDLIQFRQNGNFVFDEIASVDDLVIRPSTAVVFNESTETTYRSISFQTTNSTGEELTANKSLVGFDINYDYVRLVIDSNNITDTTAGYINGGTTLGATIGDRALAISKVTEDFEKARLNNGDMIFTWEGKVHQIDSYTERAGEDFDTIEISDVAGHDINIPATATGIAQPTQIGSSSVTIRAGLPADAAATITINISTCRATGHDFLDIGTGGFNTSNYPNVLLGVPREPDQSKEVVERTKGRVFYVSTDQDGFFRVGKFFTVDQGTGTVTFSASIALSNLDGIGFKRGVVIAEFSTDDTMANNATDTVPTQSAIRGYVNKRLGFDHNGDAVVSTIGPTVVPLDGSKAMSGNLNMASNNINNLAAPSSDSDAANKLYVDGRVSGSDSIPEMRNTLTDNASEPKMVNVDAGQLYTTTGKKRIVIDADLIGGVGVFAAGQAFTVPGTGAAGTIVEVLVRTDGLYGNVNIISYTDTNPGTPVAIGETIEVTAGPTGPILDGPFDEMANGIESADNEIAITVTRNSSTTGAELALTYKAGSIENIDISGSANIAQSKLNMNAATTRANATGIGQSDLGLVSFDADDFSVTDGWVTLKANDVDFADLPQIATNKALGNVSGSTGNITAIDITTTGAADSLVRTQNDGSIRVNSLRLGGTNTYEILSLASTTLNVKTPGQSTLLSASGTDATLVIDMPPSLDIGSTGNIASEGYSQTQNVTYTGSSRLGVEWIYGKVWEDIDEQTINTTGIALGANTGFSQSGEIALFTKDAADTKIPAVFSKDGMVPDTTDIYDLGTGALRYGTIYANNLNLDGNITLGDATSDSITIGARFSSALVPDTTNSYDIGTSTLKWQDAYIINVRPDTLYVGGGYGSTGVTISSAGAISANSTLTVDSSSTLTGQVTIGGGYGSTGTTITGAGNISTNGTLQVDSTATFSSTVNLNGNTTIGSDASDTVTFNAKTDSIIPDGVNTRTLGDSTNVWNTVYATTFEGKATSAEYADLAENYLADADYEEGHVLVFGGEQEITQTNAKGDRRIAGVVSTEPAHLMNAKLEGDHVVAVALQGRVPCKVLGKVSKGDLLVTSAIPGYAIVDNDPKVGTVIGKALENKDTNDRGVIEVVVGRV